MMEEANHLLLPAVLPRCYQRYYSRAFRAANAIKKQVVRWNLGSPLDAPDGETTWGNPVTSQAMMGTVAAAGSDGFALLDRRASPPSWAFPEIVTALVEGATAGSASAK